MGLGCSSVRTRYDYDPAADFGATGRLLPDVAQLTIQVRDALEHRLTAGEDRRTGTDS